MCDSIWQARHVQHTANSGPLETKMSTARISHRAVRGPVDYGQFNLLILSNHLITEA